MKVALAARNTDELEPLMKETGARAFACDATSGARSRSCSPLSTAPFGAPDVVVYNASFRTRGPFVDLDPADVEKAIAVTAFGGFLVAQQAARRMLPKRHGAILLTGASASVKGYAQSASFAMGKFALRGSPRAWRASFRPQGIHVAHFVIDGGIRSARRAMPPTSRTRARPGRDRGDLPARPAAAAQRVDVGSRTAAVGGEFLVGDSCVRSCSVRCHSGSRALAREPGMTTARGARWKQRSPFPRCSR